MGSFEFQNCLPDTLLHNRFPLLFNAPILCSIYRFLVFFAPSSLCLIYKLICYMLPKQFSKFSESPISYAQCTSFISWFLLAYSYAHFWGTLCLFVWFSVMCSKVVAQNHILLMLLQPFFRIPSFMLSLIAYAIRTQSFSLVSPHKKTCLSKSKSYPLVYQW